MAPAAHKKRQRFAHGLSLFLVVLFEIRQFGYGCVCMGSVSLDCKPTMTFESYAYVRPRSTLRAAVLGEGSCRGLREYLAGVWDKREQTVVHRV
jgi:hypothetical protein